MAEHDDIDQATYDRLIADGKPERIARAKAKAAFVRMQRAGGETAGAKPAAQSEDPEQAGAPAAAPPGGLMLSAEERRAKVAAALASRAEPGGNGNGNGARRAGAAPAARQLALSGPTGVEQIRNRQADKVYTWPHLIGAEFVALMTMFAFVLTFSAFAPAPLQELANPNVTPNPAKAPWYFLGLQELLAYFHPMIAGVTIPGIVGLIGLILLPYLDRNPSVKPENRKTAYALFTIFVVGAATLTLIGSFFRGPGFNWTWPWVEGIWFVL